jgi:hypothetical protein
MAQTRDYQITLYPAHREGAFVVTKFTMMDSYPLRNGAWRRLSCIRAVPRSPKATRLQEGDRGPLFQSRGPNR